MAYKKVIDKNGSGGYIGYAYSVGVKTAGSHNSIKNRIQTYFGSKMALIRASLGVLI